MESKKKENKTIPLLDISKVNDIMDVFQCKLMCLEMSLRLHKNNNSSAAIMQTADEFYNYLFNSETHP